MIELEALSGAEPSRGCHRDSSADLRAQERDSSGKEASEGGSANASGRRVDPGSCHSSTARLSLAATTSATKPSMLQSQP